MLHFWSGVGLGVDEDDPAVLALRAHLRVGDAAFLTPIHAAARVAVPARPDGLDAPANPA